MQTHATSSPAPWWAGESPLSLTAAAEVVGRDESTVYRWSTAGACGVRLRRFRRGPRGWATTHEELTRFAAAQTALAGGDL